MVYFNIKDSFSERFTIGQILIKKYLLTFNYDTKLIGFYDKSKNIEKKSGEENNDNGNSSVWKTVVILIVSFIVFIAVGFLLGKKIYETSRKKKANELIDDYDYDAKNIN